MIRFKRKYPRYWRFQFSLWRFYMCIILDCVKCTVPRKKILMSFEWDER